MTTVSQLGIFSVISTVLDVTSVKVFFKTETDLGNSLLLTIFFDFATAVHQSCSTVSLCTVFASP